MQVIAQNVCHNRRKALAAVNDAAAIARATAPDVFAADADAGYRRYLVAKALALIASDFDETTWKVCWKSVVEEKPAAEIALEFGISRAAVYEATHRVLARLREEFAGLDLYD